MVGGIVIEVIHLETKTWINCQGTGCERRETCAIYTKPAPDVQPGDQLWWQGGNAYWTPLGSIRSDIPIQRIGFSGVNRPALYPFRNATVVTSQRVN